MSGLMTPERPWFRFSDTVLLEIQKMPEFEVRELSAWLARMRKQYEESVAQFRRVIPAPLPDGQVAGQGFLELHPKP